MSKVKTIAGAAVIAVSLLTLPAHAEGLTGATGNGIYKMSKGDADQQIAAVFYVTGATEILVASRAACPPPDVEHDRVFEIVISTLTLHPQLREKQASAVIAGILGVKWPCVAKEKAIDM